VAAVAPPRLPAALAICLLWAIGLYLFLENVRVPFD
jgi:hypothetical protein